MSGMYACKGPRIGAVLLLAGWVSACVETKVSVRLQKDGTGEAAVEQYIPDMLLGGNRQGAQFFSVEKNELLLRTEAEARKLFGSRSGVKVLDFETKEIAANPESGGAVAPVGGRATRTLMSFQDIADLSTHHFEFALIPEGSDLYFVFHINKKLREQYVDKSNGGMGPLLASAVAGRFLTINVELPSRVLASNATESKWNIVEWKIPVGSIYNLVQDEILGWAKISGSDSMSVAKLRESVNKWLPGNEWRNPKSFAPYFVLPSEEPPPKPPQKSDALGFELGPK